MATTLIKRMPLLDEPGWTAWWISDADSESVVWRFGNSLRVTLTPMGVCIDGSASFTSEDEVMAYETVMRVATRGIDVIRRRHEWRNREPTAAVEGDEEPQQSTVTGLTAITALCEIH